MIFTNVGDCNCTCVFCSVTRDHLPPLFFLLYLPLSSLPLCVLPHSCLPLSLPQLGLLLACDWLLGLRTMLWEEHAKEEGVKEENCTGFYQDLDTLSKLVTLLPPAISRVSHVIVM